MQYTIRKVPEAVDRALRKRAREANKSLNDTALEALTLGVGIDGGGEIRYHDLDKLAGTWVEDPAFDRAVEEMDRIDPGMWG